MSSYLLQSLAFFVPMLSVLIVGIVLFGIRRGRIGPPATLAILGFVLHLVAYVATGLLNYYAIESDDPDETVLTTLDIATTVVHVAAFVMVILAIVRIGSPRFGAVPPPAPGFAPYPAAPGSAPYPPAPGSAPYPPAPGFGQVPPAGPYAQAAPVAPPRAHQGQEQGELVRSAVAELTEMGRFGTLSANGQWGPRVHELGQLLERSGGLYAMKEAHMQFTRAFPHLGRELDVAWNGIGGWQG